MDALAVVTEVMIITDAFLLVDLIDPIVVPYPVDLIQLEGGGLVCCLEEPVESLETGINSHAEDSLATVEGDNQLVIVHRDSLLIQPVGHVVDHVGVRRPVSRHEAVVASNVTPSFACSGHVIDCLALVPGHVIIQGEATEDLPERSFEEQVPSIPGQYKGSFIIVGRHQDGITPAWVKCAGLLIDS